jgi:hypothetical protein
MKTLKSITYRITNTIWITAAALVALWLVNELVIAAEPVRGYSPELARLIYISIPQVLNGLWAILLGQLVVIGIVLMFTGSGKTA